MLKIYCAPEIIQLFICLFVFYIKKKCAKKEVLSTIRVYMAKESDFEWQVREIAIAVHEVWSRKSTAMKTEVPHCVYMCCMYMFVACA